MGWDQAGADPGYPHSCLAQDQHEPRLEHDVPWRAKLTPGLVSENNREQQPSEDCE